MLTFWWWKKIVDNMIPYRGMTVLIDTVKSNLNTLPDNNKPYRSLLMSPGIPLKG